MSMSARHSHSIPPGPRPCLAASCLSFIPTLGFSFYLPFPIFSISSLLFFLSFMAVVLWLFMCAISRSRTIAGVRSPGVLNPGAPYFIFMCFCCQSVVLHYRPTLIGYPFGILSPALLYCLAKRNRLLIYLAIRSTEQGAKK